MKKNLSKFWLKILFVTSHNPSGPNVEMRPLCHKSHPWLNRLKWYSNSIILLYPYDSMFTACDVLCLKFTGREFWCMTWQGNVLIAQHRKFWLHSNNRCTSKYQWITVNNCRYLLSADKGCALTHHSNRPPCHGLGLLKFYYQRFWVHYFWRLGGLV